MKEYVMFHHVISIEGPYDRPYIEQHIRAGDTFGPPMDFLGGWEGSLALLTKTPARSMTMDFQPHLTRPFVAFYVIAGTITEKEAKRKRPDWELDLLGSVRIIERFPNGYRRDIQVTNYHAGLLGFVLLRRTNEPQRETYNGDFEVFPAQSDEDCARRMAEKEGQ